MKIAMIGFGQMGKIIKEMSENRGHSVVSFDPHAADATFKELTVEALKDVDVGIDFTLPASAVNNIEIFAKAKKNLVVGTTGWYEELAKVKTLVEKSENGLIYATNFSIGVNVYFKIIESAAKIINRFPDFDIGGVEYHHNKKADSPSGTAITIANTLIENIGRKSKLVYDKLDRKIEPDELHFASVRLGSIPGTHEVVFDSEAETIDLKITSRNRRGFALGAIIAAEWLKGRKGFYNFKEVIDSLV